MTGRITELFCNSGGIWSNDGNSVNAIQNPATEQAANIPLNRFIGILVLTTPARLIIPTRILP